MGASANYLFLKYFLPKHLPDAKHEAIGFIKKWLIAVQKETSR